MGFRLVYRHRISVIAAVCVLSVSPHAMAEHFQSTARYHLCFTPQHNCTTKIVHSIAQAQSSIYVQAYSFSAKPIIYALIAAKKRGIDVNVILDKSNLSHPQWGYQLVGVGVPVWIDQPAGIAHNKVMVIDKTTVITGSFNFSYSAQYKNHENVLFITDKRLANRYLDNWRACQLQSSRLLYRGKKSYVQGATHYTTRIWQTCGAIGAFVVLWIVLGPL